MTGLAASAELRARVLSSLVLAPSAIVVALAGGPVFAGVVAAGGVILAREWTRMSDPRAPDLSFALAAGAAAGAAIAASAKLALLALGWAGVMAGAAAAAAWPRGRALDAGLGALYISVPCIALIWLRLRGEPEGAQVVIFLFAAVWGADIGAYAAGKALGGPRVMAQLSPNKTWAGLAGGAMLATTFGLAAAALTGFATPGLLTAAGAAGVGLAGLGGDLLESALKRRYGVKDSGALIPGHGGLLDRVDGLMAAGVALAIWLLAGGRT